MARIPDRPFTTSSEFILRKNVGTGNISLSTTDFDNLGNPIPLTLSYSRQRPTIVGMPEWTIGNFSTSNRSYRCCCMHRDNFPFNPRVFEFFFTVVGHTGSQVAIREFMGHRPWAWQQSEWTFFGPVSRVFSSSFIKSTQTRFYFAEYFLERSLTSGAIYMGSINEDNMFYNKVRLHRRTDISL